MHKKKIEYILLKAFIRNISIICKKIIYKVCVPFGQEVIRTIDFQNGIDCRQIKIDFNRIVYHVLRLEIVLHNCQQNLDF